MTTAVDYNGAGQSKAEILQATDSNMRKNSVQTTEVELQRVLGAWIEAAGDSFYRARGDLTEPEECIAHRIYSKPLFSTLALVFVSQRPCQRVLLIEK